MRERTDTPRQSEHFATTLLVILQSIAPSARPLDSIMDGCYSVFLDSRPAARGGLRRSTLARLVLRVPKYIFCGMYAVGTRFKSVQDKSMRDLRERSNRHVPPILKAIHFCLQVSAMPS